MQLHLVDCTADIGLRSTCFFCLFNCQVVSCQVARWLDYHPLGTKQARFNFDNDYRVCALTRAASKRPRVYGRFISSYQVLAPVKGISTALDDW